ncbi:MAG: ATP-dependent zinc metalloprotease FtsH [Steroidobacteraceae bacterium]
MAESNGNRIASFWFWAALIGLLVGMQFLLVTPRAATLPYSDFKTLLAGGKVRGAVVGQQTIDAQIDLTGTQGLLSAEDFKRLSGAPLVAGTQLRQVVMQRMDDPQLTAELQAAHVRYSGAASNPWLRTLFEWVVPFLLLFALWGWMMRRGLGGGSGLAMGVGQSKAKLYVESQIGVRFADVAGIDEAKQELEEVVQFLRDPQRFRGLGGKIPKGVLIVGAPGTGKTLLAKAVAGEAGVPFLSISGSEFVEMFVGVGAARVRDLFAQARARAPCIIFIDELDALGKARGMSGLAGNDEREQTLNQLLVQMDGFESDSGVIILAATNRPEILDPALLRPGRFDRHVAIDRPDIKGREAILKVHAKNVKLSPSVDLTQVAAKTPGFAGADLANIVNEAALRAARSNKTAVEPQDFDEAIDRVVAGLEKRNRVMNPKEKETVAYHEAGHALVAESRPHADRVNKISIIPRGIGALGYTQQLPTEDRYLLKRSELLDRLDVLLGGRVAEELIYADVSTGAQDDLQRATDMARHMITQYGMSERLGQVAFDTGRHSAYLPGPDVPQSALYSNETARVIDEEVARLIREAHDRVAKTLGEQRERLEALARLLLEREVVDRAALDVVLGTKGVPQLAGAHLTRLRASTVVD